MDLFTLNIQNFLCNNILQFDFQGNSDKSCDQISEDAYTVVHEKSTSRFNYFEVNWWNFFAFCICVNTLKPNSLMFKTSVIVFPRNYMIFVSRQRCHIGSKIPAAKNTAVTRKFLPCPKEQRRFRSRNRINYWEEVRRTVPLQ